MKCSISLNNAKKIANQLGINLEVIPLHEWRYGMCVELEHGLVQKLTNVTNNDLMKTGKIALAHLMEFSDYYKRHYKMEKQAEKYWRKRKKPNIFI